MPPSFDPSARLFPRLQRRIDGWELDAPISQFKVYGPLNGWLHQKFTPEYFLVKPQPVVRNEVEGSFNLAKKDEDDEDDEDDDAGDISFDSVDSHGAAVGSEKKYPDFNVDQYWGADDDSNDRADIVRVVIEIGTTETADAVQRRVETYLDHVGSRWQTRVLGLAISRGEVMMIREPLPGKFHWTELNTEPISIFDPRFVEEVNSMRDWCLQND